MLIEEEGLTDCLVGWRVLWLLPGGVAERAGLRVGDIITEWDGMRLADFSLQVPYKFFLIHW